MSFAPTNTLTLFDHVVKQTPSEGHCCLLDKLIFSYKQCLRFFDTNTLQYVQDPFSYFHTENVRALLKVADFIIPRYSLLRAQCRKMMLILHKLFPRFRSRIQRILYEIVWNVFSTNSRLHNTFNLYVTGIRGDIWIFKNPITIYPAKYTGITFIINSFLCGTCSGKNIPKAPTLNYRSDSLYIESLHSVHENMYMHITYPLDLLAKPYHQNNVYYLLNIPEKFPKAKQHSDLDQNINDNDSVCIGREPCQVAPGVERVDN